MTQDSNYTLYYSGFLQFYCEQYHSCINNVIEDYHFAYLNRVTTDGITRAFKYDPIIIHLVYSEDKVRLLE